MDKCHLLGPPLALHAAVGCRCCGRIARLFHGGLAGIPVPARLHLLMTDEAEKPTEMQTLRLFSTVAQDTWRPMNKQTKVAHDGTSKPAIEHGQPYAGVKRLEMTPGSRPTSQ